MKEMFEHHFYHFLIYSFVIWQTAIASWLVIRWTVKNIKFYSREATPIVIEGGNAYNKSAP